MMQALKNNTTNLFSVLFFFTKSFFLAFTRQTCGGGVLRLEQSHHALAMEASGAEQHCFRPRMLPTDDWQAVVPVATGHFVQTAVLYCLRDHQQPRVADGEVEMKANFSISFIIGTRKGEVD